MIEYKEPVEFRIDVPPKIRIETDVSILVDIRLRLALSASLFRQTIKNPPQIVFPLLLSLKADKLFVELSGNREST